MRILRLTSAHRTCYLAAAFVTVATLQVVEAWTGARAAGGQRPVQMAAPAPVADVLDLVQVLKGARPGASTAGLAAASSDALGSRRAIESGR